MNLSAERMDELRRIANGCSTDRKERAGVLRDLGALLDYIEELENRRCCGVCGL